MSVNMCNPLCWCVCAFSVLFDAHPPKGISSTGYSLEMLISTIRNVSLSLSLPHKKRYLINKYGTRGCAIVNIVSIVRHIARQKCICYYKILFY